MVWRRKVGRRMRKAPLRNRKIRGVRTLVPRTGMIKLSRKLPEYSLYNSGTLGIASFATGSTVTSIGPLTAGAPVASNFPGYYNVPVMCQFKLSDVINSSELTAICDKYKINWVKLRLFHTANTAAVNGLGQLPSLLWNTDEDDNNNISTTALREKMGSKYRQFKQNGGPISIFFRPKQATQLVDDAGLNFANAVTPAKFVNSSYPDAAHYGCKMVIQDLNLNTTATVFSQVKFDITFGLTLKDIQ